MPDSIPRAQFGPMREILLLSRRAGGASGLGRGGYIPQPNSSAALRSGIKTLSDTSDKPSCARDFYIELRRQFLSGSVRLEVVGLFVFDFMHRRLRLAQQKPIGSHRTPSMASDIHRLRSLFAC
jgi:hypothetical protein